MRWRARRLKEIAEANQPAFVSTSGTHWWLADPGSKHEPSQSVSPAPAIPASESKPDEYFIAMSSAMDSVRLSSAAEECAANPVYSAPQESAPKGRAGAREEHLMWDAKRCSFVACA